MFDFSSFAAAKCERYTGADLTAVIREASLLCLKEYVDQTDRPADIVVSSLHLDGALVKVKPSISVQDELQYKHLRSSLSK